MIPATLLLISPFFLFLNKLFPLRALLRIQNIFSANLYLFSMLLNDDIVDIEKPDGVCLLNFVVDEFSGLFLHPSIFSIIHSRIA